MVLHGTSKTGDLFQISEISTYMKPWHVPVIIFFCAGITHSLWFNAGFTCTPRTPFLKRKKKNQQERVQCLVSPGTIVVKTLLFVLSNPRVDLYSPVSYRALDGIYWRTLNRNYFLITSWTGNFKDLYDLCNGGFHFEKWEQKKNRVKSLNCWDEPVVVWVWPNPFQIDQSWQVQLSRDQPTYNGLTMCCCLQCCCGFW